MARTGQVRLGLAWLGKATQPPNPPMNSRGFGFRIAGCSGVVIGRPIAEQEWAESDSIMARSAAVESAVCIAAPKFVTMSIDVAGISPYMQARFSAKAMQAMREKMEAGSTAKSKKQRAARDFEADFVNAQHISEQGWVGIPAAAFRNACIDACRMVGYKMTHAKMSLFIEADGLDKVDGIPLVRLIADAPEKTELAVRNATGVADIRVRPMWRKWGAKIRVRIDSDQFTSDDVVNLLTRAGMQVGIGEGRPFSRQSNGLGYGMFTVQEIRGV